MKLFQVSKDGGPDSIVSGLFIIEIKKLFSIVLLKFGNGSRDAFHSHAFNSISWLLKGWLIEEHTNYDFQGYRPSLKPILTYRNTFHKVTSIGTSYVLTFRGPWSKTWQELLPNGITVTLESGRKRIA